VTVLNRGGDGAPWLQPPVWTARAVVKGAKRAEEGSVALRWWCLDWRPVPEYEAIQCPPLRALARGKRRGFGSLEVCRL
jgi:hypothetical protein